MKQHSQPYTLGVIISLVHKNKYPPFSEEIFFRQLAIEGEKYGIQVIVFHPKMINWNTRMINGWHWCQGKWILTKKEIPSLIYDRCFYIDSEHYRRLKPLIKPIENDPSIQLLGKALGGKYQTYQILKKNPKLLPYLPPTVPIYSSTEIINFFKQYRTKNLLLKPNGGSHGCGVIVITHQNPDFIVRGRNKKNQSFSQVFSTDETFKQWLDEFIGTTRYIAQPFLSLYTPDARPFDVRILVQKNEQKIWEITGTAIRTGKPHTITSNLHGGGEAYSTKPFLENYYSQEVVTQLLHQMKWLSHEVPQHLEQHHGPLLELGLDIGIDTAAKIWILEVNSKPGRSIFIKTGDIETRQRAVQLPILYAHALLTSS